jgi:LPXTG-motif cell wall-anchored protein
LTGAGIDGNIGIPMIGLGALLGAVALFGLVRGRREDI